jgi:protein-S-isoprenylcysteine O-methyltransferase Ste14
LVVFGLMELANLLLDPTTSNALAGILGQDVGGIAFVGATVVLVVGAALLPEFTMSLVGLLVAAAAALAWLTTPRCEDPVVILAAGAAFVGTYWLTRRLL